MSTLHPPVYKTASPVLFIIFNRPELTEQVFAADKASRPAPFYIAADGPDRIRQVKHL
jgi:hypothetical protein